MKYYQFVFPYSRKVFGTIPNYQWDEESNPNTFNHDSDEWENMSRHFRLLEGREKKVFIPKFKAKTKSSKITNLLCSTGFNDLVIDEALKSIFENNNTFGMLYYETFFRTNEGIKLPYWMVKPRYEGLQFIDYSKTIFIKQPHMFDTTTWEYMVFKNAAQVEKYEVTNKVVLYKHNLSIIEKCECNFFALCLTFNRPVGYIVSERLKEKIENSKLTGMQFLEFDAIWP